MTIVLAIVAGIFAIRSYLWKLNFYASLWWIIEHHPDFSAADLTEPRQTILSQWHG